MTGIQGLFILFLIFTHEKEKKPSKKKKLKKKEIRYKTASSPEQDLHSDWDRFRGIMLYLLSSGELAINGK